MSTEQPPPASFGDFELCKEQVRKEIDFDLSQPIDPAILEKVNREREELERLSQKPVTELSGDEALPLILGKQLNYAEAPKLFERWWKSVDPDRQKEINVAAEDFEDLTDYQWKCFTLGGGSAINATKETLGIKSMYAQLQANMPKITEELFTSLWIDAARHRKILKQGRQHSAVKSFIDEYMHKTREVLHSTFLIPPNRPTGKQQRDRKFSKSSYEGLAPLEIARDWNRGRRRSNDTVTSAAVPKAVERYRKKREPVMWLLRLWIYQFNFPKLATRTCPPLPG
jgi:hypothetical protein